ncbi:MAG: ATP-binding protein, partial [Smithellaceae bacterium]
MRSLKAIYFINSADIPYAELRLDGNVHIAGVNGVGKSTILRAVLFFYNVNTRSLGIDVDQKSFSEFYLKFPNSYIVYEVLKDDDVYLAIVLKSQNRACFRFVRTPFLKELFIDGHHQAKTPQEIVQVFNARKLFYSSLIDRHRDAREILYGVPSDIKMRPFSLFESKSYENIPRTISNIYLNYKLESGFIKQSIIYSLVEDEKLYTINLAALQEPLGKIEGYLLDIDAYTRHEQMANDIDGQYETILAIEADKHTLAVQLGGSVKFAEIEKNDLAGKLTLLTREIHELSQKLHDLERQFQEKHDAVKSRLSVVQNELKKAH